MLRSLPSVFLFHLSRPAAAASHLRDNHRGGVQSDSQRLLAAIVALSSVMVQPNANYFTGKVADISRFSGEIADRV